MSEKVRALVKPDLLIWARESAGLSIEAAAKKALISVERLIEWEDGRSNPTIPQLRKLGQIYKRPLSVFYLPSPPKKFKALHDYRKLPGETPSALSPNLIYEIRRARERREIALELYNLIGESPSSIELKVGISDDPIKTAIFSRDILDISVKEQFGWGSYHEAFNAWRSRLEYNGLLVFQAPNIKIHEMRAFSISEFPLPVIVLNSSDWIRARIFSMLHEFAHILLREEGLCDLNEEGQRSQDDQKIEVFCNRIAGEILVPTKNLYNEDLLEKKKENEAWQNEEIGYLANKYKVSRDVILRRLLILRLISYDFFQKKKEEFESEFREREQAKGESKGFVPYHIKVISNSGRSLVRLILKNYYQERITASDVSNYLDIKLNHLPKIEMELKGTAFF